MVLRLPEEPRDMFDPDGKGFTEEIFSSAVSALNISVVSGASSDFAKTKSECAKAKVGVHLQETGYNLVSGRQGKSEARSFC